MKDIKSAPFLKEFLKTTSNMYRLGWDERNGGNISWLLDDVDLSDYLDTDKVIRTFDAIIDASYLAGKCILVTGTGKYFKNIEDNPEDNIGIVRVSQDGQKLELLWGFDNDAAPTSEFPTHLMNHIARLKADKDHRIVMHCHPANTIAMSHITPADDKIFTRALWGMITECLVVFPDGIGVVPWSVSGTTDIAEKTAEKIKNCRIIVWGLHGIFGTGHDLDEAFGLIETVEKAAEIYMLIQGKERVNNITDDQLKELAKQFNCDYRKEFLD